jgi:hypothetical protein
MFGENCHSLLFRFEGAIPQNLKIAQPYGLPSGNTSESSRVRNETRPRPDAIH